MSLSHVPYFYIIQHIPSGKLYAGSKWKEGCHPDSFMTKNGYQTSSENVKKLIVQDGLNSFKTVLVISESECFMSVYDYETIFLQSNDIASNDNWLNCHNNIYETRYHSIEFKKNMINVYGVEHPMQSILLKQKAIETNLKIRGVANPFQCEDIKYDIKNEMLVKYGVDYFVQSNEFKNKSKNTNLVKRSVENPMQDNSVIENRKLKHLEIYGVEHQMQRSDCKEKFVSTCVENFGVTHPAKREASKKSVSKLHKKSSFWNDGIKEYRIPEGSVLQQNWVKGGLPRSKYKTRKSKN